MGPQTWIILPARQRGNKTLDKGVFDISASFMFSKHFHGRRDGRMLQSATV